ncbi:MAG TPA: inner membrane-spanning protein YciB [Allosphingosinicella sp.]|nr:inner membrane-spanning protein YciB [Allosphingosinicella sp.]
MTETRPPAPAQPRAPHGLANFALDFGPLLAFFLSYKIAQSYVPTAFGATMVGTVVFMMAILIAMGISLGVYRRVSPMMWISAVLVVGFGGLTLWFHDARFIQLKPTLIYTGFAALLFGGLLAGKPLLKYVFGPVFEGLSELGWRKISRNWAWFFAAMAVLNEVLRYNLSFETWLTVKVWGVTLLAFVFGACNIPMLLRHGLTIADPEPTPPPTA